MRCGPGKGAVVRGRCGYYLMVERKWMRKGHDPVLIGKGQALLRWRGIGGHLQLPMGSIIRGVEFDMVLRERVAHERYGWQPLERIWPCPPTRAPACFWAKPAASHRWLFGHARRPSFGQDRHSLVARS